jgi:ABC-type phosphate transport system substrate-binding protein
MSVGRSDRPPGSPTASRSRPGYGVGILLALLFLASAEGATHDVAVIVNPENRLSQVSRLELVRLFQMTQQRWPNGEKIYLIMQEQGTLEKQIVLHKIYRMNSDELKRFWLTKIYRGELTSFPKTLGSNESIRRFVSRVRNAVGFVDASFVDDSVKAVRIDGKLPGSAGYLLSANGQ